MTNSDCREIEDSESTSRLWLVPFLNFWVTMVAVAFIGYGITPERCNKSFDIGPTLGVGWGVAGILAAVLTGFMSEFIVESQVSSGLALRSRIQLAVSAAFLVSTGAIYLGIRFVVWAYNNPLVL